MKHLYFISLFILFIPTLHAQTFSLVDIVTVSEKGITPAEVEVNQMGGQMSFTVAYTSTCNTNYKLGWSFSKDISSLNNGETFDVTLNCLACNTNCGKKWTQASVGGANNIFFSELTPYESTYNGNMKTVGTAGTSKVNGWSKGNTTHTYTVEINKRKEAKYTAFYIYMGGHKVHYIFTEGAEKKGATNCHSLLGLGKLVNALEMGALNGYGSSWMVETAGYAVQHIQATNCLDDSYLLSLQKRLQGASQTRSFLTEIRNYSAELENEVTSHCDCCTD